MIRFSLNYALLFRNYLCFECWELMNMFLHVTSAKYLEDYKIRVSFNNGREGIADLSNALKGKQFELLKNKIEFANFSVDK